MKFCPTCNQQNDDSTSFCVSCGAPLDQVAPAQQAYAPPPQPQAYPPQQQAYAPPPPQQGYPPAQQAYAPPPQGYPPQQQGYPQQGGYAPPPPKPPGNAMGVASMVLGIIALVFCWVYIWNAVSLVLSVVGLVLAIIAKKKNVAVGAPAGMATAGLVTSIIALALSAILFITCTVCICVAGNALTSAFDWAW